MPVEQLPESNTDRITANLRIAEMLSSLDHYIARHRNGHEQDRTLREKQFTVFEDLRNAIADGKTEGYIKLPTGTGKTVLFIEFVEATKVRTLISVPTKLLVDQTGERFEEFAGDVDIGKIYTYAKERGRQVTITTYNSLVNGVENGAIQPDDYDLLILDEAHKSLSPKRQEAVRQFSRAIKIGLTATPSYSTVKNLKNLLNTEIHSMIIKEAVEAGLLSPFSVYLAKTSVDISNVSIRANGEYSEKELERAININARNESAVDLYTEEPFHDQSTVVFCVSVEHARDVARHFRNRNVASEAIYGSQNRSVQEEIRQKFRDGEIKVLCNANLLIEGFDEPRASLCLNLRPTLSPVVAEQRGGRVLRLDPNNPDKHAFIVDFIDETTNKKGLPVSFAQVGVTTVFAERPEQIPAHKNSSNGDISFKFSINGLQVITDQEEVLRITNKMAVESQRRSIQPAGWTTSKSLSRLLHKDTRSIQRLANKHRENNPEWFLESPGTDKPTYYSPQLSSEIIKEVENLTPPPENWMGITKLKEILNISSRRLKDAILRNQEDNPELYDRFLDETGRIRYFLAPELALKIIQEIKDIKIYKRPKQQKIKIRQLDKKDATIAPENWLRAGQIATTTSFDNKTVKSRAEKYRDEHPEWFGIHLFKNRLCVYYAPELATLLKQELESINRPSATPPPGGWMAATKIGKPHKVDTYAIRRTAEKYRDEHPEWFGKYLDRTKHLREYYSPKLIDLIKREFGFEG